MQQASKSKKPGTMAGLKAYGEGLLRLFDDLDQTVVLVLGEWTALFDANTVADAGGVFLIVCLVALGTAHNLAVQGVLLAVLDLDDDGLLHLVRNHVAGADLASTLLLGRGFVHVSLAHY